MKKFVLLLLLIIAISGMALAQENTQQTLTEKVQGLLTEVYGYTQTEAEAFSMEVSQEDDTWAVRFYNHPGWEYTAAFKVADLGFLDAASPFFSSKTADVPENSVRSILCAMKENGWLSVWDAQSRAALEAALQNDGDIYMSIELRNGLEEDAYTPSQALDDFFSTCYGNELYWQPALVEWRDQVFEELGLLRNSSIAVPETGVYTRQTSDKKQACEFLDAVPQELTAAFAHPNLQGYECLAGAYRVQSTYDDLLTLYGSGLAAFERDGQRMLVMLYKLSEDEEWQLAPVGEQALLKDRALYITYTDGNSF